MRVFVAFIISLLIYTLLFWFFITQLSKIEKLPIKEKSHVIKISLKDIPLPIKKASSPSKEKVVKKPLKKVEKKKTMVPKKPKKKPVPKKKVVAKKKVITKKKVVIKPKEEMLYIEEPFVKSVAKTQSNDLSSFFSASSSSNTQNYPSAKVQKLYGSSFHSFTPTQKKFIEEKLESIQQITQRTLTRRGYPEGAGTTGQEGTNVVSFNLHPNGDIANLRLKTRIGYRALDDNTLTLIRVAYKDYPYPETTTKIIFYVTYSIYGY